MVTYRKPPIDFSTFPDSDGEPVAENKTNWLQAVGLVFSVEDHLRPRRRFCVGGGQFIYYNRRQGRDHVTPDVYVALDVEPGIREKWETWREGDKFPDVVFEIISESTQDEDLGHKVELYGRLGAREYYIYDPEQRLDPPLRAFHQQESLLVPMGVTPDMRIYSPALDVELRVIGDWLRLIDPHTGQPVLFPQEYREAQLRTEQRLQQEMQARLAAEQSARERAEAHLTAEQSAREQAEARLAAEVRARQAEQARLAAEGQAQRAQAQLEAALERLRRLEAGDAGTPPS